MFERNQPDDTFGWGVVLSAETLDNLAANDAGERRLDPRILRLLGRHRRHPQGRAHRLDRARLLRHRPQAAAPAAAAARPRPRHRARLRDGDRRSRPLHGEPRPGDRRRRAELALARRPSPRSSSPTSTCASASSSGSAPARSSTTPSPSSSRRPSTAGYGRTPTSSSPETATFIVECGEETWAALGLRRHDARADRSRPASGSSPAISAATA